MRAVHLLTAGRDQPDLRDLYDQPGPYVRAGMVTSLDGCAALGGRSAPLQAPGDRAVFRALRAVADVVLVGAGTARVEDYGPVVLDGAERAWRRERQRSPQVALAVVSRSLALDAGRWVSPDAFVITCASAPPDRRQALRAQVLVAGEDQVDLADAVAQLASRGLTRVLCEGGPGLLGDVVRAGLLTEVCATVSPLLAGEGPGLLAGLMPVPVPLRLVHLLREQDTLLGRWEVLR